LANTAFTTSLVGPVCAITESGNVDYASASEAICTNQIPVSKVLSGTCQSNNLCNSGTPNSICGKKLLNGVYSLALFSSSCQANTQGYSVTALTDCTGPSTSCSINQVVCVNCQDRNPCWLFQNSGQTIMKKDSCASSATCELAAGSYCHATPSALPNFISITNTCDHMCSTTTSSVGLDNCVCPNTSCTSRPQTDICYPGLTEPITACDYTCKGGLGGSACTDTSSTLVCVSNNGNNFVKKTACSAQCGGYTQFTSSITGTVCVVDGTNYYEFSSDQVAICDQGYAKNLVKAGKCVNYGSCKYESQDKVCSYVVTNGVYSFSKQYTSCEATQNSRVMTAITDCDVNPTSCSVNSPVCVEGCVTLSACAYSQQSLNIIKKGACDSSASCELPSSPNCFDITSTSGYSYFFVSSNQCDKICSVYTLSQNQNSCSCSDSAAINDCVESPEENYCAVESTMPLNKCQYSCGTYTFGSLCSDTTTTNYCASKDGQSFQVYATKCAAQCALANTAFTTSLVGPVCAITESGNVDYASASEAICTNQIPVSKVLSGTCQSNNLCNSGTPNSICGKKLLNGVYSLALFSSSCQANTQGYSVTALTDCTGPSTSCSINQVVCVNCQDRNPCWLFQNSGQTIMKKDSCASSATCELAAGSYCHATPSALPNFISITNTCDHMCSTTTSSVGLDNCVCPNTSCTSRPQTDICYPGLTEPITACDYTCKGGLGGSACTDTSSTLVCVSNNGNNFVKKTACSAQCGGYTQFTSSITGTVCVVDGTNYYEFSSDQVAICDQGYAKNLVKAGKCVNYGSCKYESQDKVCSYVVTNGVYSFSKQYTSCEATQNSRVMTAITDCDVNPTSCSVNSPVCVEGCVTLSACAYSQQSLNIIKKGACDSSASCELPSSPNCFDITSTSGYSYFFVSSNQCDKICSVYTLSQNQNSCSCSDSAAINDCVESPEENYCAVESTMPLNKCQYSCGTYTFGSLCSDTTTTNYCASKDGQSFQVYATKCAAQCALANTAFTTSLVGPVCAITESGNVDYASASEAICTNQIPVSKVLSGTCQSNNLCNSGTPNSICGKKLLNGVYSLALFSSSCQANTQGYSVTALTDCTGPSTSCSINQVVCVNCQDRNPCWLFQNSGQTIMKKDSCASSATCELAAGSYCHATPSALPNFISITNTCDHMCSTTTSSVGLDNCVCPNTSCTSRPQTDICYPGLTEPITACDYTCKGGLGGSACTDTSSTLVCVSNNGNNFVKKTACSAQCGGYTQFTSSITGTVCVVDGTNYYEFSSDQVAICDQGYAKNLVKAGKCVNYGSCKYESQDKVCSYVVTNGVYSFSKQYTSCEATQNSRVMTAITDCDVNPTSCSVNSPVCVEGCVTLSACAYSQQSLNIIKKGACDSSASCELPSSPNCFDITSTSGYSYFFVSSNQCDKICSVYTLSQNQNSCSCSDSAAINDCVESPEENYCAVESTMPLNKCQYSCGTYTFGSLCSDTTTTNYCASKDGQSFQVYATKCAAQCALANTAFTTSLVGPVCAITESGNVDYASASEAICTNQIPVSKVLSGTCQSNNLCNSGTPNSICGKKLLNGVYSLALFSSSCQANTQGYSVTALTDCTGPSTSCSINQVVCVNCQDRNPCWLFQNSGQTIMKKDSCASSATCELAAGSYCHATPSALPNFISITNTCDHMCSTTTSSVGLDNCVCPNTSCTSRPQTDICYPGLTEPITACDYTCKGGLGGSACTDTSSTLVCVSNNGNNFVKKTACSAQCGGYTQFTSSITGTVCVVDGTNYYEFSSDQVAICDQGYAKNLVKAGKCVNYGSCKYESQDKVCSYVVTNGVYSFSKQYTSCEATQNSRVMTAITDCDVNPTSCSVNSPVCVEGCVTLSACAYSQQSLNIIKKGACDSSASCELPSSPNCFDITSTSGYSYFFVSSNQCDKICSVYTLSQNQNSCSCSDSAAINDCVESPEENYCAVESTMPLNKCQYSCGTYTFGSLCSDTTTTNYCASKDGQSFQVYATKCAAQCALANTAFTTSLVGPVCAITESGNVDYASASEAICTNQIPVSKVLSGTCQSNNLCNSGTPNSICGKKLLNGVYSLALFSSSCQANTQGYSVTALTDCTGPSTSCSINQVVCVNCQDRNPCWLFQNSGQTIMKKDSCASSATCELAAGSYCHATPSALPNFISITNTCDHMCSTTTSSVGLDNCVCPNTSCTSRPQTDICYPGLTEPITACDYTCKGGLGGSACTDTSSTLVCVSNNGNNFVKKTACSAQCGGYTQFTSSITGTVCVVDGTNYYEFSSDQVAICDQGYAKNLVKAGKCVNYGSCKYESQDKVCSYVVTNGVYSFSKQYTSCEATQNSRVMTAITDCDVNPTSCSVNSPVCVEGCVTLSACAYSQQSLNIIKKGACDSSASCELPSGSFCHIQTLNGFQLPYTITDSCQHSCSLSTVASTQSDCSCSPASLTCSSIPNILYCTSAMTALNPCQVGCDSSLTITSSCSNDSQGSFCAIAPNSKTASTYSSSCQVTCAGATIYTNSYTGKVCASGVTYNTAVEAVCNHGVAIDAFTQGECSSGCIPDGTGEVCAYKTTPYNATVVLPVLRTFPTNCDIPSDFTITDLINCDPQSAFLDCTLVDQYPDPICLENCEFASFCSAGLLSSGKIASFSACDALTHCVGTDTICIKTRGQYENSYKIVALPKCFYDCDTFSYIPTTDPEACTCSNKAAIDSCPDAPEKVACAFVSRNPDIVASVNSCQRNCLPKEDIISNTPCNICTDCVQQDDVQYCTRTYNQTTGLPIYKLSYSTCQKNCLNEPVVDMGYCMLTTPCESLALACSARFNALLNPCQRAYYNDVEISEHPDDCKPCSAINIATNKVEYVVEGFIKRCRLFEAKIGNGGIAMPYVPPTSQSSYRFAFRFGDIPVFSLLLSLTYDSLRLVVTLHCIYNLYYLLNGPGSTILYRSSVYLTQAKAEIYDGVVNLSTGECLSIEVYQYMMLSDSSSYEAIDKSPAGRLTMSKLDELRKATIAFLTQRGLLPEKPTNCTPVKPNWYFLAQKYFRSYALLTNDLNASITYVENNLIDYTG
jgi:hypothetical protein